VFRKLGLATMLFAFLLVLSGCTETTQPITAESEGIWNQYFVYPLSFSITYVAELFNENYGVAIIIVTIFLRLLLLPLMITQTKSTKAMQAIQPEMQALREKYSAKDQQTQQKLQQETMKLFQEHKVNPFAGCLPLLVQMPILIAFYHAIIRTSEISQHSFLWFALGEPDRFVLPIIAGLTTYIQQKMMTVPDNPQMKMMLYLMPIMIFAFAMFFPSALSLYWVIGNIFMIVQTYFITGNKAMEKKELKAGGNKK